LIKDVYDSYLKDSTRHYYIGTLVTYKRGDNEYEVIDGQQRLTTIYIILKALGVKDIKNKLTYSARKASASTIDKLDNYPNLGDEVDSGIRNGYKFAKSALENIVGIDSPNTCDDFIEYFTHKVHIIHYRVPKDVDLNHYFEVMNSRGEQLEKHEIVKSILSQYLKDRKDLSTFGRVWEACSEMNLYIQQAYPEKDVFSKHLDSFFIDNFKEIPQQAESEGKETIIDLLTQSTEKFDEENTQEQIDLFIEANNIENEIAIDYLNDIVKGLNEKNEEIENLITKNLKQNWSINRVSKINISLIKIAIYEMLYKNVPYKVAINEVVELAKNMQMILLLFLLMEY
jgi:transcription termination factor NusB